MSICVQSAFWGVCECFFPSLFALNFRTNSEENGEEKGALRYGMSGKLAVIKMKMDGWNEKFHLAKTIACIRIILSPSLRLFTFLSA